MDGKTNNSVKLAFFATHAELSYKGLIKNVSDGQWYKLAILRVQLRPLKLSALQNKGDNFHEAAITVHCWNGVSSHKTI
mgnify:CR=1 FL=1